MIGISNLFSFDSVNEDSWYTIIEFVESELGEGKIVLEVQNG